MKKKVLLPIATLLGIICLLVVIQPQPEEQTVTKKSFEAKKRSLMAKFTQEIQMTKDPSLGYVPHERLLEARVYTEQMIEMEEKTARRSSQCKMGQSRS